MPRRPLTPAGRRRRPVFKFRRSTTDYEDKAPIVLKTPAEAPMTRSRRSHSIFDLVLALAVAVVAAWAARRLTPPPAPPRPPRPTGVRRLPAAPRYRGATRRRAARPRSRRSPALDQGRPAPGSAGSGLVPYDPSYDLGDPGIGKLPPVRDQLTTTPAGSSPAWRRSSRTPAHRPRGLQRGQPGGRGRHRFRHRRLQPRELLHDHRRARALERSDRRGLRPTPATVSSWQDAPITHVQNVLFLPDRTGFTGTANDTIKWAIMN